MATEPKRPSLLINTLSNWASLFTTVFVGFFLASYIIGQLGKTGFGIWTLVSSIVGYYGILDLGIDSATVRYVARYAGQKDYKALNQTASTAMALFCLIGLAIVGISFGLAEAASEFFNVAAEDKEEFKTIFQLLGLTVGLSFPGNLFGAILKAHERFVPANLVDITIILARAGLIVLFLSQGMGLLGVAYAHLLVSGILMLILNYAACKLLFPHVKFHLTDARSSMLRVLLTFGGGTTVLIVATHMRFNFDSFIIGTWLDMAAVGVYGVAVLLMRFFRQFVVSGTIPVFNPRFSRLDGENKRDELRQLFLKSLTIGAFLSFSISTAMLLFGKQFVGLWAGPNFLDAVPVLYILIVAYSMDLGQSSGVALMYALKKHHFFAFISLIEGAANIGLSIWLAQIYGILGVAIGTAIPMLLITVFIQPIYVSRIIEVSLWRYWLRIIPPLALAITLVALGFSIPEIIPVMPENSPAVYGYAFLVLGGLPLLAVFAVFYALVYNRDLIKRIFRNNEKITSP
ncbi:MAG: oligosaccharide flippase family protein [Gammaproteobacteria bacterium]|nr:oligosaccharide flippase family protein [Gammaproteobacteria bacterium]